MSKRGRKSKRTPELESQLLGVLQGGATIADACAYVGISHETYHRWMNEYPDFCDTVQKARATARITSVATIRQAAKGNWTAAAWFLERSDPANWGRRDKLIIEGNISIDIINQTVKALESAGLDPAQVFNELIQEAARAQSTVDSAQGD